MVKRQGDMAESMRKSLRDETARVEDRFAKAEAIFGETKGLFPLEGSSAPQPLPNPKVIRDTFSMPVGDYELLDRLKTRALTMGIAVNKSELIRAGLRLLNEIDEGDFRTSINRVDKVKLGRPKY